MFASAGIISVRCPRCPFVSRQIGKMSVRPQNQLIGGPLVGRFVFDFQEETKGGLKKTTKRTHKLCLFLRRCCGAASRRSTGDGADGGGCVAAGWRQHEVGSWTEPMVRKSSAIDTEAVRDFDGAQGSGRDW